MTRASQRPLLSPLRRRDPNKTAPAHLVKARDNITIPLTITDVNPFGVREFGSFADFKCAWNTHEKAVCIRCSTRDSTSRLDYNLKLIDARVRDGLSPTDEDFVKTLLPVTMPYKKRIYRCIHSPAHKSKSAGLRFRASSRFTECSGRITVEAIQKEDGSWVYTTKNEVIRHNHRCTKLMLESYANGTLITEEDMFLVRALVRANAPTRNICDLVALLTGAPFTAQQLANFKRDHLGGTSAFASLRGLVSRYLEFDGCSCLILDDENGRMVGIMFQSAAQKAIFERWGENLILDWTHNTNNVGYYLGSLMVTTVTGKGVSVADFLCVRQSYDMMRDVFSHFIATNPGAVERVKSFIIDKDLTEWAVLKELFPTSRILLCQFHVLKWFLKVVGDRKYELDMATRERVLEILRAMVYASSISVFEVLQRMLRNLLQEVSPQFLRYMHERWYSIREMWSTCERGGIFTALNTTSNRLEACWAQIKKILGKKLRIDLCVEAIFIYQTAVLRREYKLIARRLTATLLRSQADPFIRAVCREISDYCFDQVMDQWAHYTANANAYVWGFVDADVGGVPEKISVETLSPGSLRHTVDCTKWTCDCNFSVTSALPCRHVIFVARHVLHLPSLPMASVPARWSVQEATEILPILRRAISEIQTLRTSLLRPEISMEPVVDDDPVLQEKTPIRRSVVHVRVPRGRVVESTVLDDLQKRKIVRSTFESVTKFLMASPSHLFRQRLAQVDAAISGLMASWGNESLSPDGSLAVDSSPPPSRQDGTDNDGIEPTDLAAGVAVAATYTPSVQVLDDFDGGEEPRDIAECFAELEATSEDAATDESAFLSTSAPDDTVPVAQTPSQTVQAVEADTPPPRTNASAVDVSTLELHVLPRFSATRLQRATDALNDRLAFITQRGRCVVSIVAFVWALMRLPGVERLFDTWRKYPVLFGDKILRGRIASAHRVLRRQHESDLNFAIPMDLLFAFSSAVRSAKLVEGPLSFGDAERGVFIAKLLASLRGFTEPELETLHQFYAFRKKHTETVEDMSWVKSIGEQSHQADTQRVCSSICTMASSCSLLTGFQVQTPFYNHGAFIVWGDVVGYLAGERRLDAVVLVYCLRQMAAYLDGVFIAPPPGSNTSPLPSSLTEHGSLRRVLFPVCYDNGRWCLVTVEVEGGVGTVLLYDPLNQRHYHDQLFGYWRGSCEPFLRSSTCVNSYQVRVVHGPCHPNISDTGVMCLIQARLGMEGSEDTRFHELRDVKAVVSETRLRALWCVLSESRRVEVDVADEQKANNILASFLTWHAQHGT